jgi:hypothetical protein
VAGPNEGIPSILFQVYLAHSQAETTCQAHFARNSGDISLIGVRLEWSRMKNRVLSRERAKKKE